MEKFLNKCKLAEPIFSKAYKAVMILCKLMLIADILVTAWIVLARFVPKIPAPNWGEEVILTLMAYMAVLSASLAIRKNAHIRMTVFDSKLSKKTIAILDIFSDVMVLILAVIMMVEGWKYANKIPGFYVSMVTLRKFWQYFPVSLAGFAMIFFEIERLFNDLYHLYDDFTYDEIIEKETLVDINKYAAKKKEE